jgi:hypothetical protein
MRQQAKRQKDMEGVKHETRRKWQLQEVADRAVVNEHHDSEMWMKTHVA